MRAVLATSFLLVSMFVFSGCGSSSKNEAGAEIQATQPADLRQHADFKKRCGDPTRFPISDECVQLAGADGARLRRQSDLTMAMWRACALTPTSAETIRQEVTARGQAKTQLGQTMIGEMERTEQHSDSPCVAADLRDLDCVAGNSDACEMARQNDSGCAAWQADADTQERLHCIDRAVHDPACLASQQAGQGDSPGSGISDAQAQADDCRRMENACLHTFDECSNAKDALEGFLNPQKSSQKSSQPSSPSRTAP
jgi:hypothetical protein